MPVSSVVLSPEAERIWAEDFGLAARTWSISWLCPSLVASHQVSPPSAQTIFLWATFPQALELIMTSRE